MQDLKTILPSLPYRHQVALKWFFDRSGEVRGWPGQVDIDGDLTFLVTKGKGIYKPEWSQYALSVRHSLDTKYPDLDPIERSDGTWLYQYFQENEDAGSRDDEYTNVGLLKCWEDQVPVGIAIQVRRKPNSRYKILGLAQVASWDRGYFTFEGFSRNELARNPASFASRSLQDDRIAIIAENGVEPALLEKATKRVQRQILLRRGQPRFRANLLVAYGASCAISGCDAVPALEAAHIVPYHDSSNNDVTNGILLRADLHTLFDLHLISVDSRTARILLANELKETTYREFAGEQITFPKKREHQPSTSHLEAHRLIAGL